jgi:hypothetical protein
MSSVEPIDMRRRADCNGRDTDITGEELQFLNRMSTTALFVDEIQRDRR